MGTIKPWEELSFRDDYMFKRVMSHKRYCKKMLEKVLDGKRHMYTFQNVCMEDRDTVMPDGTTKILLSTKGTMEDVPPDMKAFLEYVDGKMVEDDFAQEIEQEIKSIKSQEQERVSYMTYAMKIQEERDEARAEGKAEGKAEGIDFAIVNSIRNLMKNMKLSAQQAMDVLEIPVAEQARYAALI